MVAELTKMLQSAAKGKAPIVAIPMEGHAPVCLNRKRLATWIKGVEILSVEVVTPPDVWYFVPGKRLPGCRWNENKECEYQQGPLDVSCDRIVGDRKLKIEGRAGRVKTTCTMFVIRRHEAALEIGKWAQAERAKNLKIIGQGAISTVALKEAKKAAKAKERAAKLIQMEKGGCEELEDAKAAVLNIYDEARSYGRGPEKKQAPSWEKPEETAMKQAESIVRHVAYHNVSPRVRKTAAVIYWRLKALRTEWFEVTKFNFRRRKTTANKFLKVKKAIQVIQIVKDHNALLAQLRSIKPERIPHPRWPDEHAFAIDPLDRPGSHKRKDNVEWHDRYDRASLAKQLRTARETIRVLTPPPDAEEMDIAA